MAVDVWIGLQRGLARLKAPAAAVLAALMLAGPTPAQVETAPAPATARAYDFIDGIGVGVHLAYADTDYARVQEVLDDLRYLGVRHVRDNNLDPRLLLQESFHTVAAAGFKFDLIVSGDVDPERSLAMIRAFEQAHPGAMAAIEGPNEINNFPVTYRGRKGPEAAVPLQAALYQGVKRDPVLKKVPVYNFTSWPDFAGAADFANFHSYPKLGAQPLGQLTADRRNQRSVMPSKPMVLTEAGYYSLPNGHGWGGVDEPTQARLLLNLILDGARLGARRTYIYQLLDSNPDPGQADQEKHFGLFATQNRRKPAADALHTLIALLADPAPDAASFRPKPLSYRTSGLPGDGASLLLQKASGVFELLIWDEPKIWDGEAHAPVAAPARAVAIDLGRSFRKVSVYDPTTGPAPTKTYADVRQVQVELGGHPLVLELQ